MQALIFDLDGTLVDTVYAHVFAWQRAFAEAGLAIDGWRIHRRIGMSGGLFTRAAGRELGRDIEPREAALIQERHGQLFREFLPVRRPLPGAVELLHFLRSAEVPHGIATSGVRPDIDASLEALRVPPDTVVIERRDVARAKPEPDLFIAAQRRLQVEPNERRHARGRVAERRLRRGRAGARGGVPRLSRRRGAAPLARRAGSLTVGMRNEVA
jgi:beta-phosphoglucomutase-like phosphatase (HAD superfamily)